MSAIHDHRMSDVVATMLEQLGQMTIWAISGGRVIVIDDETVLLPVSAGYDVEAKYIRARDLYRVRRVRTVRGTRTVLGTLDMLYAEQLPGAAYQASCYASDPFP